MVLLPGDSAHVCTIRAVTSVNTRLKQQQEEQQEEQQQHSVARAVSCSTRQFVACREMVGRFLGPMLLASLVLLLPAWVLVTWDLSCEELGKTEGNVKTEVGTANTGIAASASSYVSLGFVGCDAAIEQPFEVFEFVATVLCLGLLR